MQQFVVPQFIDVEDKIIGPITVRQFLIMLVGGLLIFIAYRLADFTLFIIFLAVVGGLTLLFAFGRWNGQNFHYVLLNLINYFRKPPQRIWQKGYDKKELRYLQTYGAVEEVKDLGLSGEKRTERKHINELALVVNTGGYYQGEE